MNKYISYKDSGVEWIGEIPEHWKITRLKFLGKAIGGMTYSPKDIVYEQEKGVLVLRSSNIQKGKLDLVNNVYINSKIPSKLRLRIGDILICSRNGSPRLIGKNIMIDKRTEGETFGAFMMVFRSDNHSFLYNFFNSPIFKSQSGLFLTSTINQLTSGTLNNFYIAYPESFEEQIAIANYLEQKTTEIDTLITNKEKLIKLLEEEKTAVVNQAVTKGLDSKVPMKDSGVEWLGEIPEHWKMHRLGFITQKIGDGLHGTPSYVENSSFPFINGNNLMNGKIKLTDKTKFVSEEEFMSNNRNLDTNTILISLNGTIGNLAFYAGESVMLSKSVGYLRLMKSVNKHFIYYFLKCKSATDFINLQLSGSTINNLSLYSLNKFPIPYPTESEQIDIVDFIIKEIHRSDKIIMTVKEEVKFLKEYKTALISEVVTGKVDVRGEVLVN